MEFDQYTLFTMIKSRMSWAGQRQEVLARNIANADTPGYKPRDLAPLNFKKVLEEAAKPEVATTNSAHQAGLPVNTKAFRVEKQRNISETAPNGNAVTLEDEMLKVGEAKGAHDLAANLFQKHVKMMRTAIGGGR
jgi:flagellar basal-body rod protein FlgB